MPRLAVSSTVPDSVSTWACCALASNCAGVRGGRSGVALACSVGTSAIRAKKTHCPYKGEASYWTLKVGDRESADAVWSYPAPIDGRDDIAGYMAFYWNRVDQWFEEDDEVFAHPRDPYHRVDVLRSSR